jgi:hypothetical protein
MGFLPSIQMLPPHLLHLPKIRSKHRIRHTHHFSSPLLRDLSLPRLCLLSGGSIDIAGVLSFTSPPDACRSSSVSTNFRSAAESDVVWESFLPPQYKSIISRSADSTSSLCFSSKKELYLHLCDHPLLIDEGKKAISTPPLPPINFSLFQYYAYLTYIYNTRTFGWRKGAGRYVTCFLPRTS